MTERKRTQWKETQRKKKKHMVNAGEINES